jgi:hypothetical protein
MDKEGLQRKDFSVRRIVVLALSVILALVVAMPMASGKPASTAQKPFPPGQLKKNLPDLTAEWWNWASSMDPSPLEGEYPSTDPRCEGEYVEGVFFLAGSFATEVQLDRTCTVPAHTPIFFPIVNVICSEAYGAAGQVPPDPEPYDTECAEPLTDATVDPPSTWFATLDGQDLEQQRIASGVFNWNIKYYPNPFYAPAGGLPVGTWESATDGLWVFLSKGLKRGEHTIEFGGTFKGTPFNDPNDPESSFEGAHITYHLTAVNKAGR